MLVLHAVFKKPRGCLVVGLVGWVGNPSSIGDQFFWGTGVHVYGRLS
jgi:hypothetical protein